LEEKSYKNDTRKCKTLPGHKSNVYINVHGW